MQLKYNGLISEPENNNDEQIQEFLEKKNYVKVPLSVNSLGHFETEIVINGIKGNFIIDTGASGTVINDSDILMFNLTTLSDDEDKAAGLGTTTLHVQKSKGNEITLGEFTIENWEVGIIHLGHVNEALETKGSGNINGVIGADIMNTFDAVIDYKDKALYLKKKAA